LSISAAFVLLFPIINNCIKKSLISVVMVEWSALLHCIQKIMDSYSSQKAGFPEVLLGFLLSLKAYTEMVP